MIYLKRKENNIMPRRIAVQTLQASTLDILNTIRANASYEYQQLVPDVKTANDIPKVGEVLFGYPALANQFISTLVNRIALVRVRSANFNNMYSRLKKGYLEFGETVEEVFVNIVKAREFSAEKAEKRELKRSLPDVRTAFHSMNWRVQYPITIQDEDLRMAFTSMSGVTDLIAKIVDAVYTAAEYDEFLLFKYLMIKAIAKGQMYPKAFDPADIKNAAKAFRGVSNQLTFMSNKYNAYGVHTTTPRGDQIIFMDASFNAEYDVDVLAAAFNMDKATYTGALYLIDDWTTFDNDRFSEIMEGSNMIEPVTEEELALMKNVKAVLIDEEWFQVYDNQNKFTEKYVASGEYWNYFYNVWKTVSSSPFSNAIVLVADTKEPELPASVTLKVADKSVSKEATVVTVVTDLEEPAFTGGNLQFVQTEDAVKNGVAVHRYGAYIFPAAASDVDVVFTINGKQYKTTEKIGAAAEVGGTLTATPVEE